MLSKALDPVTLELFKSKITTAIEDDWRRGKQSTHANRYLQRAEEMIPKANTWEEIKKIIIGSVTLAYCTNNGASGTDYFKQFVPDRLGILSKYNSAPFLVGTRLRKHWDDNKNPESGFMSRPDDEMFIEAIWHTANYVETHDGFDGLHVLLMISLAKAIWDVANTLKNLGFQEEAVSLFLDFIPNYEGACLEAFLLTYNGHLILPTAPSEDPTPAYQEALINALPCCIDDQSKFILREDIQNVLDGIIFSAVGIKHEMDKKNQITANSRLTLLQYILLSYINRQQNFAPYNPSFQLQTKLSDVKQQLAKLPAIKSFSEIENVTKVVDSLWQDITLIIANIAEKDFVLLLQAIKDYADSLGKTEIISAEESLTLQAKTQ